MCCMLWCVKKCYKLVQLPHLYNFAELVTTEYYICSIIKF